jgi:hypothetical protein
VLKLHKEQKALRPVVHVYHPDGSGLELNFAVGGDETVMGFQSSLDPPNYISLGDPNREGLTPYLFCSGMQGVDESMRNLVPWESALMVLDDFLSTQSRSTIIEWEEV